jgi:hypothetical protein
VTTAGDDTSTPQRPIDRPADRDAVVRDVVVVLVSFLVAGVAVGLLWPQVVDPVTMTRTELGLTTGEVPLALRFEHDAWYSFLGAGVGLVLGLVLTWWRRTHETATLVAVVLSSLLAAAVSSWVGTATGPESAELVLADAELGATAPDQVQVTAEAAYLAWPLGAVAGAVIVLWGPWGAPSSVSSSGTPARAPWTRWSPSGGSRGEARGEREHTPED